MAAAAAGPAHAQDDLLQALIDRGPISSETSAGVPSAASETPPPIPFISPDSSLLGSLVEAQDDATVIDRAFPLREATWPDGVIYVCWEEMPEEDEEKRQWVREAAEGSWEAESALDFRGWKACFDESIGIRIKVDDSGPHVVTLGKFLDGQEDGMVLNFTYENWSPSCRETLEYCIRTIAVHEFGHAIGFAHEQNRLDTPGECLAFPQGQDGDDDDLTSWDPDSVMNYCNPRYNNDGELSELDIFAVREIYGAPS